MDKEITLDPEDINWALKPENINWVLELIEQYELVDGAIFMHPQQQYEDLQKCIDEEKVVLDALKKYMNAYLN